MYRASQTHILKHISYSSFIQHDLDDVKINLSEKSLIPITRTSMTINRLNLLILWMTHSAIPFCIFKSVPQSRTSPFIPRRTWAINDINFHELKNTIAVTPCITYNRSLTLAPFSWIEKRMLNVCRGWISSVKLVNGIPCLLLHYYIFCTRRAAQSLSVC